MSREPASGRREKWYWYVLLIIPFITTLYMPLYASPKGPELSGIPMFYWWMFLWIILSALITGFVYFVTK
jgi:hypothetical protein